MTRYTICCESYILECYIFSCDQRKHYLRQGTLRSISVNKAKTQNTCYALAPHIAVLGYPLFTAGTDKNTSDRSKWHQSNKKT